MLGLGNSLTGGAALEQAFTPESISNIAVWLAWNTNITADENTGGTALDPDHTTADGNMAAGDRISSWNAAGSTSVNATQDTTSDKPRWTTDAADIGGVKSSAGNKHMDLSSNITFPANTDFTIVIRFKPIDVGAARAFMGHSADEFIRLADADTIRVKSDGTTNDFDLASGAIATDKYTTLIIVRSDGSTGNINLFIRGAVGGYFDGTATGTAFGDEAQDTEEIIVSNIMAQADNSAEFKGTVKDVIMYNGTAVTAAQREQLFDYLDAQED